MPGRARTTIVVAALAASTALAACSSSASSTGASRTSAAAVPATPVPATEVPATTVPSSAVPATTMPATTTTPVPVDPQLIQTVELGRSVEGRAITAVERGTTGGTVVLVIGVIHGDEDAGLAIVDRLATQPVPDGIDLWLVPSINPDGQANGVRHNANQVDLNRNFPYAWAPLGQPGYWEYGGTGPASEPETKAAVALIERIRPDLAIWYHQDLNRVAPAQGRDGEVRRRYAELTGLPLLRVTGGTYTGVAATWQRRTVPEGVAFIVELGPSLSAEQAAVHAGAVYAVVPD